MIRIAFFGDFCVNNSSKLIIGDRLKEMIDSCDYKVCNFEAPIKTANTKPISKSGPAIEQPKEAADFLLQNGFNLFLLANNHMMDYGIKGLNATLETFQHYDTVGAGSKPYDVKICHCKNTKIGFLALSQNEFGIVKSIEHNKAGVAWICDDAVGHIIKETKLTVDYLFVCPHAGIEDIFVPLPNWREKYKYFIDCGADAIIASHPHTPQGWELYNDKYIFYSLGNFCFDLGVSATEPYFNIGLCVEIEIDDNYFQCKPIAIKYNDNMVEIDFNQETQLHLEYISKLLNDEIAYNEYLDLMCEKLFPLYKYGLLRGLRGCTTKLGIKNALKLFIANMIKKEQYPFLLNTFQCESHRWLLERYLNNKIRKAE